jgi:hypothetical protein
MNDDAIRAEVRGPGPSGLRTVTLVVYGLQALSFFFFLPSILMSGFMFPFRGMPAWAQMVGEVLPLEKHVVLSKLGNP